MPPELDQLAQNAGTTAQAYLEVQGRMIVAPTDGGSAVITVSSADRAEADRVAEAIIESLSA